MTDKNENPTCVLKVLTDPHIWYRLLFFFFAIYIVVDGFSQPFVIAYKMSTIITWGILIACLPDGYLGIVRFIKWLPNRNSEE